MGVNGKAMVIPLITASYRSNEFGYAEKPKKPTQHAVHNMLLS